MGRSPDGLGHDGTKTRWDTINVTKTRWDWDTMGLRPDGIGTQWD